MNDTTFTTICTAMKQDISDSTPYDTGNLANNATLVRSVSGSEIKIYVDEKIAPYFRAVNCRKSYTVNAKGGGKMMKQNRNYMYFERAFDKALRNLANSISGEVIKVDRF